MTDITKKSNKSIKAINYLLFVFIIYISTIFYMSETLRDFKILFFWINLFILILFYILNKRYELEYNDKKRDIKTISSTLLSWKDSEVKDLLFKKSFYKENEENYNLFKNMYIRKNILAKDYADLKNVFHKFIPEWLLKEIGEKGTDKISLWLSVKKYLNVMFLDIIWFTTITEKIPSDKALLLLNVYFDWIVEIIKNNWWYVDKFLWDGIMIIFDSRESDNAVKAAVEIQNFIDKIQVSEIWWKIWVWIWINSWEVILWTVWSRDRMEITIIWDVVNIASRLEWLTRSFPNNTIISETTFKNIQRPDEFSIKDLWIETLRWRKSKLRVHGVDSVMNLKL